MTEPKIKDADDLISRMNNINDETKNLFRKIALELEEMVQIQSYHSDMLCLVHCEDRTISLEAFNNLDEERREGVTAALRLSIENLKNELDQRSKGMESDPQMADATEEEIRELLDSRYGFVKDLGIGINETKMTERRSP